MRNSRRCEPTAGRNVSPAAWPYPGPAVRRFGHHARRLRADWSERPRRDDGALSGCRAGATGAARAVSGRGAERRQRGVFRRIRRSSAAGQRQAVVIDPLVNGVTGEQSAATRQIQDSIVALAQDNYPQFDIQPFSAANVSKAPYVMVGTFTPVNAQGQTAGAREAYRFCLVMVDLQAGKTVAKGVARAHTDGVDPTPGGFFRDSPAWTNDPSIKSYIDTCQATKVGDAISPAYLNGILTASIVSEAIEAYDANRYRDALELYASAQKTPAGNQLQVYNGLYLTNWKLGHRDQAEEAFGRVVDYGLANNALGVKILFRPGSTSFESDPQNIGQYDMWLRQIADRSASRNACLQVTGNSSPSGAAALNDLLSQLRAEYVKGRLETDAPPLRGATLRVATSPPNNSNRAPFNSQEAR